MTYPFRRPGTTLLALALATLFGHPAFAQRHQAAASPTGPWMDANLSPDERADLVIKEMTLDEKIAILHGWACPRTIR